MNKRKDFLGELEEQRKVKKHNLSSVAKYFAERGFHSVKLEQQWRHVTGVLEKGGKKFFLKLASTPAIAERTKNEAEWNKLINSLPAEQTLPITVPKVYEEGAYNEVFWFISSYIDGPPLVLPKQRDKTQLLEESLPVIAQTSVGILRIKTDKKLPNDLKRVKGGRPKERYLEHIQNWLTKVERDVSDVYRFIEDRIDSFQTAPSHGDYVPWHILIDSEYKLHLIDGEHSGVTRVKFSDLAYFYHRVYTKLKRPDIADEFIKQFKKIYKFSEKDTECACMVIAHRLIGGYFDAQTDNVTSIELQDKLKAKLLENKII